MKKRFRILIVDDDLKFAQSVATTLRRFENLETLIATTAEYAVRLLPEVDAVLADCVFPYAQDFEAAVRGSGKPMIRMSGQVDRALNLELRKPFGSRELVQAIQMLLFLHEPRVREGRAAA
jgi:DNA-binding response OmpR family regulator